MNNSLPSKEKELELINAHTTVPLTEDQVFRFTVTLCDNEIDRDFERFTDEALDALSEMFIGKTGICDHSMRSKDQCSRIFYTFIETTDKKTSTGETYKALKARAYILRTQETASLIAEIEGGIKKEVSISCSVNKSTCSICGGNMKTHSCKHIKGKSYGKKLCYALLSEPTDAYEWSFVAVPAQRNAGVTKSFRKKEDTYLENPTDIIKSLTADSLLSDGEVSLLKNYIAELEKLSEEARIYKKHLTKDIERLALIVMPKVNLKAFISSCATLNADELRELKSGLEAQVSEKIPTAPQIKSSDRTKTNNNSNFKI